MKGRPCSFAFAPQVSISGAANGCSPPGRSHFVCLGLNAVQVADGTKGDGAGVTTVVGTGVGSSVGAVVGEAVGVGVGRAVGEAVGVGVGTAVGSVGSLV